MATKTKTQVWNEVLGIAKEFELSEEVIKSLSELLEPKRGGGSSSRIIKTIDGEEYRNCRFTNKLWKLEDLIYQNDEMRELKKDKGYSKVGISLWNKGQKYIKDLKEQMTEIILSDKPDNKKLGKLKNELKEIEAKNLGNDAEWLLQFATEDQLKEIKNNTYDIDYEV